MGIRFENLDETTRSFMRQESTAGGHYQSPRLNHVGLACWVEILNAAIDSQNDDWLANELQRRHCFNTRENYTRSGKTYSRDINVPHAAQQLAEGEFNRYYLRGLCRRAIESGIQSLVVYRGNRWIDRDLSPRQ